MSFLLYYEQRARAHRRQKRHAEIVRIIEEIGSAQRCSQPQSGIRPLILEFGCGNGFQIPYLEKIGEVVATDIYTSNEVRALQGRNFCESSITDLPFADCTFDLIFSNHVVEHLPDPAAAFTELRRVARPDCLFAFSVPTNYWLMLAVPAKYLGKCAACMDIVMQKKNTDKNVDPLPAADHTIRMSREGRQQKKTDKNSGWMGKLLPIGHGVHTNYIECYRAFRIPAWNDFFVHHGFAVNRIVPLLLYGPSELPIIPTTRRLTGYGICSSVLFLMTAQQ